MKFVNYNCIVTLKIIPKKIKHTRTAVNLAYQKHGDNGDGPPVVVLHGLLGSKRNWQSMSKMIASLNRKVIAVDIRNHGESGHSSTHTYSELASDVSKLLDTLSLKRPAVIGHSMGGRTGMALALLEPDKIHSLVAVDISPVSTAGILNDFFPKLIDEMKTVNFQSQQDKSVAMARIHARDQLMKTGMFPSADSMHFILMNVGMRDGKIGWLCNLDALKDNFKYIATFPDDLKDKQFGGPVLFIGGEASNYIPPGDIDGIRKLFPKADLKYVRGVGHNVHAENPSKFFELVKEFLSK